MRQVSQLRRSTSKTAANTTGADFLEVLGRPVGSHTTATSSGHKRTYPFENSWTEGGEVSLRERIILPLDKPLV